MGLGPGSKDDEAGSALRGGCGVRLGGVVRRVLSGTFMRWGQQPGGRSPEEGLRSFRWSSPGQQPAWSGGLCQSVRSIRQLRSRLHDD